MKYVHYLNYQNSNRVKQQFCHFIPFPLKHIVWNMPMKPVSQTAKLKESKVLQQETQLYIQQYIFILKKD